MYRMYFITVILNYILLQTRGWREWLSTFPFPPVRSHAISSHSQVGNIPIPILFPWGRSHSHPFPFPFPYTMSEWHVFFPSDIKFWYTVHIIYNLLLFLLLFLYYFCHLFLQHCQQFTKRLTIVNRTSATKHHILSKVTRHCKFRSIGRRVFGLMGIRSNGILLLFPLPFLCWNMLSALTCDLTCDCRPSLIIQ